MLTIGPMVALRVYASWRGLGGVLSLLLIVLIVLWLLGAIGGFQTSNP